MREVFRDVMLMLGVIFAGLQAYFQWRGPSPTDPPGIQTATQHPVVGLIIVAVLFVIAGVLNSAPLLSRFLPAAKPKQVEAVKDAAEQEPDSTKLPPYYAYDKLHDSDPKLEVRIADLRGKIVSDAPQEQACFDLINRGKQSPAKFACIEDFQIGGYKVAFRNFPPPIQPFNNHESITPLYINNPDGTLCHYNIFEVFLYAWGDLKNSKLYEYSIPIKVTYQDEARNLFELHCDLVFYPSEHADRSRGQMNNKVIETKNHRLRKVAPALYQVDWSD